MSVIWVFLQMTKKISSQNKNKRVPCKKSLCIKKKEKKTNNNTNTKGKSEGMINGA